MVRVSHAHFTHTAFARTSLVKRWSSSVLLVVGPYNILTEI